MFVTLEMSLTVRFLANSYPWFVITPREIGGGAIQVCVDYGAHGWWQWAVATERPTPELVCTRVKTN
jgi:hypothetical protein